MPTWLSNSPYHPTVLYYRAKPTPHIRLAHVSPTIVAVYDGSAFAATTSWWNTFLSRYSAFEKVGIWKRYEPPNAQELAGGANPENQKLLASLGAFHAPGNERLGAAVIGLAYALARTLLHGLTYHDDDGDIDALPMSGREITIDRFEELGKRYTIAADYYFEEMSPGWWAEKEGESIGWSLPISAMRWAYRDQVSRWETGEGRRLGKGIGWAMGEGVLMTDFSERLFEMGGRVAEAEIWI